jgi:hypothetical protein
MVDGDADFVAVNDSPDRPPILFKAADVAELQPHWDPIARALAGSVAFDPDAWETSGHLRRIGSSHDPFGRVSAVLLFLPPGHLGDDHGLFRELSLRQEATVLFPTARWFTAEIEALRSKNHLDFVDLADRLARIDSEPASAATPAPLPVITKPRDSAATRARSIIHAGNGLTWSPVRIQIQAPKPTPSASLRDLCVFAVHPLLFHCSLLTDHSALLPLSTYRPSVPVLFPTEN